MKNYLYLTALLFCFQISFSQQATSIKSESIVVIDGEANEPDWTYATWYPIDQVVLGGAMSAADFSGRFKSIWDEDYIYLYLEITDDSLSDDHSNPTDNYWNDDCVEIFIDEDKTGEDHQYNHNAFAYHVNIFGDAVDTGLDHNPILLPEHIKSTVLKVGPDSYQWEIRISVYDKTFNENNSTNTPVKLFENKEVGFTVAYCDNDETTVRENFILSNPGQGDTGWINSTLLGSLKLVANPVTGINIADSFQSTLYPNPFSETLTIELKEDSEISLVNTTGLEVYSEHFEKGTAVINPKLKKGVYVLTISSNSVVLRISVLKQD